MTEELPPPRDLQARFPVRQIPKGFKVIRVHKRVPGQGPWYFSSGNGRFDLVAPLGTCYVADSVVSALAESLGEMGELSSGVRLVETDAVACRCVRVLKLPAEFSAADLTSPRAANFGADRLLSVDNDRQRTKEWAGLFREAEFGAILYETKRLRGALSIALFGKAGQRRGGEWRSGRGRKISQAELNELKEKVGIIVLPKASLGELKPFIIG